MKAYVMPAAVVCGSCGHTMFRSEYLAPGKVRVWCVSSGCENEGVVHELVAEEVELERAA